MFALKVGDYPLSSGKRPKTHTDQKGTGLFWQVLSGQTLTAAGELLSLAAIF